MHGSFGVLRDPAGKDFPEGGSASRKEGLLYFLWAYFVRLGFLDGGIGLRYHALHAIYKHFDETKLWELRQGQEGSGPTYWQSYRRAAGVRSESPRRAA